MVLQLAILQLAIELYDIYVHMRIDDRNYVLLNDHFNGAKIYILKLNFIFLFPLTYSLNTKHACS